VIQVNVDLIEFAALNYAALLEHIPIAASMITKEEYIKIFCEVHMHTMSALTTINDIRYAI